MKGADGKNIRCEIFQIARGVLQGDVTSPLYFIMDLELILRRHDPASPGQGVPLADTLIRLLGYADDVAAAELGDARRRYFQTREQSQQNIKRL